LSSQHCATKSHILTAQIIFLGQCDRTKSSLHLQSTWCDPIELFLSRKSRNGDNANKWYNGYND